MIFIMYMLFTVAILAQAPSPLAMSSHNVTPPTTPREGIKVDMEKMLWAPFKRDEVYYTSTPPIRHVDKDKLLLAPCKSENNKPFLADGVPALPVVPT
jgi:hypothetical protein